MLRPRKYTGPKLDNSISIEVRLFLACLSGVLLTLSFPRFSLAPLAWLALVPFFVSIQGQKPRTAALFGLLFGVVHFAGLLYWVTTAMRLYGHLSTLVSISILLLLVVYLALYFAGFAFSLALTEKAGLSLVAAAPALWVSFEYLRSILFTGLPWENLSYSQYATLSLIQVSDITGNYGISFYIVMANSLLGMLFYKRRSRRKTSSLKKSVMAFLVVSLAFWSYGYYRLKDIERKIAKSPTIEAAVIQGNIRQDIKWDQLRQRETIDIYSRLSRKAAESSHAEVIIWPETAVPFCFGEDAPLSREVKDLSRELNCYLLFGAPCYEKRGVDETLLFNSAFLLSPAGSALGRYDKIHLVPFGEYVPVRSLLPFAGKLVASVGDFAPGGDQKPFPAGKVRIGALICFESIFPELARKQVLQGANFLVTMTNDAWFGRSSAPYQHMSMSVFRAVENRVSLARAANTGISTFVEPSGKITRSTAIFEEGFLRETLPVMSEKTIYTRWGDVFPLVCIVFAALMIMYSKWRNKNYVVGA
ncbi:MAG: apolipoprotein N-acyltransferase [Pseudomonadota bacterium]